MSHLWLITSLYIYIYIYIYIYEWDCHAGEVQGYINNIWHLHSLSIDESQSNV